MLLEHARQLGGRHATEAAVSGDAEVGQQLAGKRDAVLEAGHVVDHAQIDPCALGLEVLQRREEGVVGVSGSTGMWIQSTRRPEASTVALASATVAARSGGAKRGQPPSVPKQK